MIQKRYQYRSKNGIIWTKWFNTFYEDKDIEYLRKYNKYQEQNKLLNEFKIV